MRIPRPTHQITQILKILSWNCCSLQSKARKDHLILLLNEHHTDIAFIQESWLPPDPDWQPPGWIILFSTPSAQTIQKYHTSQKYNDLRGQSLVILVRATLLNRNKIHFHEILNHNNKHYQLQAAILGDTLIINTYVSTKAKPKVAFKALVEHIVTIRGPDPTRSVIVCGDFNHPNNHNYLKALFISKLGLYPLLNEQRTREKSDTAPDNIFSSPNLELEDGDTLPLPRGDHFPIICESRKLLRTPANNEPQPQSTTRPP